MQTLESYDEYKDMVREIREKCKRPFSNMYFMQADIERYIRLRRVNYERTENGIVFFFDEEKFYRVCLYIDEKENFLIRPQKKKILIKNVFMKGKKRENLLRVEQQLEKLGFEKTGISVKIRGYVPSLFQKCKQMRKYAEVLTEKGYRFVVADYSMFEEIETLVLESGMVKDYQLNYRTDKEKKELKSGSYLCIMDEGGKICAGNICVIEDNIARGVAMAVKEKYKMHGFAPALSYYRLKWLYDNDIKYVQAWILINNEPSLRYYHSLGYEFIDEYVDEWVIDVLK